MRFIIYFCFVFFYFCSSLCSQDISSILLTNDKDFETIFQSEIPKQIQLKELSYEIKNKLETNAYLQFNETLKLKPGYFSNPSSELSKILPEIAKLQKADILIYTDTKVISKKIDPLFERHRIQVGVYAWSLKDFTFIANYSGISSVQVKKSDKIEDLNTKVKKILAGIPIAQKETFLKKIRRSLGLANGFQPTNYLHFHDLTKSEAKQLIKEFTDYLPKYCKANKKSIKDHYDESKKKLFLKFESNYDLNDLKYLVNKHILLNPKLKMSSQFSSYINYKTFQLDLKRVNNKKIIVKGITQKNFMNYTQPLNNILSKINKDKQKNVTDIKAFNPNIEKILRSTKIFIKNKENYATISFDIDNLYMIKEKLLAEIKEEELLRMLSLEGSNESIICFQLKK